MSTDLYDKQLSLCRRSLLRVALRTLPTVPLSGGPLAALWPAGERDRDVDEPYLLSLEGGCVLDPAEEGFCVEPTLRDLLAVFTYCRFGGADGEELDDLLVEMLVERDGLDPERDRSAIEVAGAKLSIEIDEPADLGVWGASHVMWLDVEGNRAARSTWDLFPTDALHDAGLYFMEGDRPGSDFTSICVDGTVEVLDEALARVGLNVVVEERSKCPTA